MSGMSPEQMMAFLQQNNPNASNGYQQQQQPLTFNPNQAHISPLPPTATFPPRSASAQGSYPPSLSGSSAPAAMSDQEAFLAQFTSGAPQQPQRPPSGQGMQGGGGGGQGPFGAPVGNDIMKQMEAMQRARQASVGSSSSPYSNQQFPPPNAILPSTNSAGSPQAMLGGGGQPNFVPQNPQQQAQLLLLQQQFKLREQQQHQQKQRTSSMSSGYGGGQMGSIIEGVVGREGGGGGSTSGAQPGSPSMPQGNNPHPPTRPSSSLSQHQYSGTTPSQPSPALSNGGNPSQLPQPSASSSSSTQPPSSSSAATDSSKQASFLKALTAGATQKGVTLPSWFLTGEGVEGGRVGTIGLGAGVAPDGGGGGQRVEMLAIWQAVGSLGGLQQAVQQPANLNKLLKVFGIPATLATPTPIIELTYNPANPPRTTTNPAEVIFHAYMKLVTPFDEMRQKSMHAQRAAAQAQAAQNGGGGVLGGGNPSGAPGVGNLTKEEFQAYMQRQVAAGAVGGQPLNGSQQAVSHANPSSSTPAPSQPPSDITASSLALPTTITGSGPSPTPSANNLPGSASTLTAPSPAPPSLNLNMASLPTSLQQQLAGLQANPEIRRMMSTMTPEQQQSFVLRALQMGGQGGQAGLAALMAGAAGTGGTGDAAKPGETEEESRERKNKKRKVDEPSAAAGTSSAVSQPTPLPSSPSSKHRLRHKIAYIPLQRDPTTYGGWDVDGIEHDRLRAQASRKARPVNELGAVDVEGLLLSLQSRMQTEVAYALGVLQMLSVQPSGIVSKQGEPVEEGVLPLKTCPEVLEELLELLEEVSVGEGEMVKQRESWGGGKMVKKERTESKESEKSASTEVASSPSEAVGEDSSSSASSKLRVTHSALVLVGREGADELRSRNPKGERPTRRAELITVVINIVRNLSNQHENTYTLGHSIDLLQLLMAVCEPSMAGLDANLHPLPLSPASSHPILSVIDLLNLRKDVLYILYNLSHDIPFSNGRVPLPLVQAIFNLVTSFLFQPDGDFFPSSIVSPPNPLAPARIPIYVELALGTFTRLTVTDDNRAVFGKLPASDLWALYDALVKMLPVTEPDYIRMGQMDWLGLVERLTLSIYNLVFLSPSSVKHQIRSRSSHLDVLVRILYRFLPLNASFKSNDHYVSLRRILETFGVLNEGGEGDGAGVWLDFGTGRGKETEVKKRPRVEMPGWLSGRQSRLVEIFFKVGDYDKEGWEELEGLVSDM